MANKSVQVSEMEVSKEYYLLPLHFAWHISEGSLQIFAVKWFGAGENVLFFTEPTSDSDIPITRGGSKENPVLLIRTEDIISAIPRFREVPYPEREICCRITLI